MRASVVDVSSNVDRISDFIFSFYVQLIVRKKKKYPVEFIIYIFFIRISRNISSKIIPHYFGIKSCFD